MPSDNGAAATAMAAAAAAAAQQAADEAHRARCQVVMSQDPRGSVDSMQAFSSCVEFVYPQFGPATTANKVLYGGAGLAVLICIIVGAVWMYRSYDRDPLGALCGAFFGLVAGGLAGVLILGAAALVQFLLS